MKEFTANLVTYKGFKTYDYMPNTNVTKYQNGVYVTGINLFNILLSDIPSPSHEMRVFSGSSVLSKRHESSV